MNNTVGLFIYYEYGLHLKLALLLGMSGSKALACRPPIIFVKGDLLTLWGACLNQMQRGVFCARLHVMISVICGAQICIWGVFFFLCYSYPITVLLSCCMQRWHRTGLLFICIHPPSLQPSGLPGPVLLCPRSVSLSLMPSLLPSPPLFAAAFFWSLSPLLVKDWHGQKREEGEDAGMSNSCWYCRIIASQLFWGGFVFGFAVSFGVL